ncbi:MAG: hypothetical protein M3Y77_05210 [Actinomycetota bacterium]|nr:hypothetical protein [Actinomycetota bacterium]
MTTPGSLPQPRRGGFLSNISSALTPPVVTDDDPDKPLVLPTGLKVATALVILAGVVFLFLGANSLINLNRDLDAAVTSYNSSVADCAKYSTDGSLAGGINGKAKSPANASSDVTTAVGQCNKILQPTVTADMKASAKSRYTLVSWVLIIVGLVSLGAGWFLRTGTAWARRATVGLVVVTMILTMFLGVSNLLTMAATLFLVIAVLMCYLGRGSVYFAMTRMRRQAA